MGAVYSSQRIGGQPVFGALFIDGVAASGSLASITLAAPTASASVSGGGSVTATGSIAGLSLSAPAAVAVANNIPNLIVEDGTGMADAESYASVATADAYHSARGNAAWAALSTQAKEIALRNATDYMAQAFGGLWKGDRVSATQALDWPRANVMKDGYLLPSNVIPTDIVKACCELALRASAGSLMVDVGAQVKTKQVGPIAVTFADGARQQIKYAAVDNMLRGLLSGGGSGIRLVRA